MELVDPAASPTNASYSGIITAGAVTGGSSWENTTSCQPNVLPEPPAWCACSEQACMAKAVLD